MRLSIIIPAYNEEKYLDPTLDALKAALSGIPDQEIIVVDDESTDRTAEIGAEFGVRVVQASAHNIGRVRNLGAAAADGDIFVFIDADTRVKPGLFEKVIEKMSDRSCAGGSVAVEYGSFERRKWARTYLDMFRFWGKVFKMRQGAAQFCSSEVFRELGGYDETIYVGEDIDFHWRLDRLAKRDGKHTVVIEEPPVTTSSRRFEKMPLWRAFVFTHPVVIFLLWRFRSLWKDWYQNAIR